MNWVIDWEIELIVKTREDTTIALNNDWSKRLTAEKKKNEEKIESWNNRMKQKQEENDMLRVCIRCLFIHFI